MALRLGVSMAFSVLGVGSGGLLCRGDVETCWAGGAVVT